MKGGTVGGQKRPSHGRSLLSRVTILILKFLRGRHRDFYKGIFNKRTPPPNICSR